MFFSADSQILQLNQTLEANANQYRQQYQQLSEQCSLLKVEAENRVRETDEIKKLVREKEYELSTLRSATKDTLRQTTQEELQRDSNREKVLPNRPLY